MIATTQMPEAVLMGFAFIRGRSLFLNFSGMALIMSTSLGIFESLYFLEHSMRSAGKLTFWLRVYASVRRFTISVTVLSLSISWLSLRWGWGAGI